MCAQSDLFQDRVKQTIGGESVRAFSQKCGISDTALRKYLSGESEPGLSALKGIAAAGDVTVQWLATGEGPMRPGDTPAATCVRCGAAPLPDDFILVPRYDVQASAGGGADVHSEQVVDHLAFKRDWVRDMGLQQGQLVLITARGDSMEPTIRDGALLLVDTREVGASDGIYVLKFDGSLLAKRVHKNPVDQSVTVTSDNPIYQPFTARGDQVGLLAIVGRVVWIGQRI